jgi:hypothetical protein
MSEHTDDNHNDKLTEQGRRNKEIEEETGVIVETEYSERS